MVDAEVDLDKVLEDIGEFGPYQRLLYIFVIGPLISSAMYNAQYIFTARDINYRCVVPECEELPAKWSPGSWKNFALKSDSRCVRYKPRVPASKPTTESCKKSSFYEQTQKCDKWVYETQHSVVADFNLACYEWKRTLVGTMHSLGVFMALIGVGMLSDRFGRKTIFVTTAWAGATMGVIRSFVDSYVLLLIFEFLEAFLSAGVYSNGLILVLEMVDMKKRVPTGCYISCMYASGRILLALVAYLVPNWRNLTRIIYIPPFVYISYYCLLDESFRWLFSQGKNKKAVQILKKIAAKNRRELDESLAQKMEENGVGPLPNRSSGVHRTIICDLFHSNVIICRVLLCSFCWSTITLVYYGLSINSVSLAGSIYWNYCLTSVFEIPGYLLGLLTFDRFGRRRTIMAALSVCAASLIILPFIPSNLFITFIQMDMAILFIISQTAKKMLNFSNVSISRTDKIELSPNLPFFLFGVMSGLAAIALLWIPETSDTHLPDTLAQAEKPQHTELERRNSR